MAREQDTGANPFYTMLLLCTSPCVVCTSFGGKVIRVSQGSPGALWLHGVGGEDVGGKQRARRSSYMTTHWQPWLGTAKGSSALLTGPHTDGI